MNSKFRWLIFILLIPITLSGCASVVFVDRSNSLVMPDHVARKILAKYFGEEWVQSPYLEPVTNVLCNLVKVPVNFSDIKNVRYESTFKKLYLFDKGGGQLGHQFDCGYDAKRLSIGISNESDVQQITEALIALGVPIKGYVYSGPFRQDTNASSLRG